MWIGMRMHASTPQLAEDPGTKVDLREQTKRAKRPCPVLFPTLFAEWGIGGDRKSNGLRDEDNEDLPLRGVKVERMMRQHVISKCPGGRRKSRMDLPAILMMAQL